jgi:hypothetical protein
MNGQKEIRRPAIKSASVSANVTEDGTPMLRYRCDSI